MNVLDVLDKLAWQQVPDRAITLYKAAEYKGKLAQTLMTSMPTDELVSVHYSPTADKFKLTVHDLDVYDKYAEKLAEIAPVCRDLDRFDNVPVLVNPRWQKSAAPSSPFLRALTDATFITEGPGNWLPMKPNPLAATIAGSMLGAGTGYGVGWALEHALPDNWEKGKLRRTLAMLGGGVGAVPGVAGIAYHLSNGIGITEPGPLGSAGDAPDPVPGKVKVAGFYDDDGEPIIPIHDFVHTIMTDPDVAPLLHPAEQAATAGLLGSASYMSGGSPFVTPSDVGRIAAGAGSGYVSGWLVGKALGALIGMPQETQDTLKRTGMYAGIIKNVVPIALGRPLV